MRGKDACQLPQVIYGSKTHETNAPQQQALVITGSSPHREEPTSHKAGGLPGPMAVPCMLHDPRDLSSEAPLKGAIAWVTLTKGTKGISICVCVFK